MASRLIGWFTGRPRTEPAVHFHTGPESTPAVCFDEHCGIPRLDV